MENALQVVRESTRPGDPGTLVASRARFALRTLGGLTLLGPDGREVESLATRPRKLVVLAWIAMRRTPATRDQAIGVFWGGRDEARARNSLSDALSHIRRVLGPGAVPAFSERVALADDVPLVVDALALTTAAANGDHARVVEFYAGEFLDGVHVDDSTGFERWRDGERTRLAALFTRSAHVRTAELARLRQWESCAALARRWLEAEPASADAALRLLEALAAPDSHAARVAALVAFENIRERLRRDLGVAPAPAVVERARQLATIVASTRQQSPIGATQPSWPSPHEKAANPRSPGIVGRTREQQALSESFERATRGEGSLVCISGEPGMGKSTLVESWLAETATRTPTWVARGRCSERLAEAEAYLPVLDALDHLAAGRHGAEAAAVLRHAAPVWRAQLAPVSRTVEEAVEASGSPAPTPARMKRELVALFQELSRTRPVVLFLDDVHWSDASTVDILAYLATHLRTLRVLVVVTYREEDLRAARHPILPVVLDLECRAVARAFPLAFFSVREVAQFAERELPSGAVTPGLAAVLHETTEGSPLFVAELLRELRARVADAASPADLERAARSLMDDLPRSVRALVQRKIERLSDADRRLLTLASVQGIEFDVPIVAEAIGADAARVEERLDAIADGTALVCRAGEHALLDGALGARYRFVHALYQNTLYGMLGPARRRAASAAVAGAIVKHRGEHTSGMDADLAFLYEAAGDAAQAVHYFTRAADDAARRMAHREAVLLWRRALGLISSLPDTPERAFTEMRLQFCVGCSTMIIDGYAAPEARAAHAAAAALAVRFDDVANVFPLVAGLFSYYVIAGDARQSARLAERMCEITCRDTGSPFRVMSDLAAGFVLHSSGDHARAHATFERAVSRYDPAQHAMHLALFRLDARLFSMVQSSRTFWLTGHADRALTRAEQAVAMARSFGDPGSLALAMTFITIVRQLRRESLETLTCAEETIALCDAHDIAQERAWVLPLRGWALATLGRSEGITLTREAVAAYTATGARHTLPYYHVLLADVLLAAGAPRDGITACDEGLLVSARIGEVAYDAELHRLRGECLLRGQGLAEDAEREFETALRLAHAHQARLYALRAATSLASACRHRGRMAAPRTLLAPAVEWFTEGLETHDLVAARRLLGELAGSA